MARFDWPALMRAGMQGLGLRPAEFWALTPAELRLMLGQGGAAAMTRGGLDALMAEWPDQNGPNQNGPDQNGPDDKGDLGCGNRTE